MIFSRRGDVSCIAPAYGPTWSESDDFFHVILEAAGADENDLGN